MWRKPQGEAEDLSDVGNNIQVSISGTHSEAKMTIGEPLGEKQEL